MLGGLVELMVAAEVARSDMEVQQIADSYYATVSETEPLFVVSYDVSSRGTVKGDMAEFRKIVAETLADKRGWIRAGVKFEEVESGGRMHVILAEPDEVKAASPTICSEKLSCSVGSLVLLNDDRWMGGSDSYNEIGVSLERYRWMVLNHEVGHFLGHGHIANCETEQGVAPVMLQQSTGLRGCEPNSWPLPSELWVRGL